MTEAYFLEIKEALQQGATNPNHAFRMCAMATVGLENIARQRLVVLREVSDALHLTFYTDRRSKKVLHLHENRKVSLLFYHPEKYLQVRVEGLAVVNKNPSTLKKYWNSLEPKNKLDYSATLAPGSPVNRPDVIEYLEDESNFCTIVVDPFKIEYLKLQLPHPIKVRYSLEGKSWESQFLVP